MTLTPRLDQNSTTTVHPELWAIPCETASIAWALLFQQPAENHGIGCTKAYPLDFQESSEAGLVTIITHH